MGTRVIMFTTYKEDRKNGRKKESILCTLLSKFLVELTEEWVSRSLTDTVSLFYPVSFDRNHEHIITSLLRHPSSHLGT